MKSTLAVIFIYSFFSFASFAGKNTTLPGWSKDKISNLSSSCLSQVLSSMEKGYHARTKELGNLSPKPFPKDKASKPMGAMCSCLYVKASETWLFADFKKNEEAYLGPLLLQAMNGGLCSPKAALKNSFENNKARSKLDAGIIDLKDADKWVRFSAADTLGQLKDKRAVVPLIAALKDEYYEVRKSAAKSLGQLKDKRAVVPLIAALKDEYKDVRYRAAQALGRLKDKRAVAPLIVALKDEEVRSTAAYSLGELKDKRAVAPLIAVLKDEYLWVRLNAAKALGDLKDKRAVAPLTAALKDENVDVRNEVSKALAKLSAR